MKRLDGQMTEVSSQRFCADYGLSSFSVETIRCAGHGRVLSWLIAMIAQQLRKPLLRHGSRADSQSSRPSITNDLERKRTISCRARSESAQVTRRGQGLAGKLGDDVIWLDASFLRWACRCNSTDEQATRWVDPELGGMLSVDGSNPETEPSSDGVTMS